MNLFFLGIIIFLIAHAVNRFVMTAATKKLSDLEKLKIFEVFSSRNNYSTIFLIALILLFFAAIEFLPQFVREATIIYSILVVGYLVFKFSSNLKKLREMEMPASYVKSFVVSYGIFSAGFFGMVFCVLWIWIA